MRFRENLRLFALLGISTLCGMAAAEATVRLVSPPEAEEPATMQGADAVTQIGSDQRSNAPSP